MERKKDTVLNTTKTKRITRMHTCLGFLFIATCESISDQDLQDWDGVGVPLHSIA